MSKNAKYIAVTAALPVISALLVHLSPAAGAVFGAAAVIAASVMLEKDRRYMGFIYTAAAFLPVNIWLFLTMAAGTEWSSLTDFPLFISLTLFAFLVEEMVTGMAVAYIEHRVRS